MFFGNIFHYKFFDIYKVSYLLLHTLFYVINIAIKVSVAWNISYFNLGAIKSRSLISLYSDVFFTPAFSLKFLSAWTVDIKDGFIFLSLYWILFLWQSWQLSENKRTGDDNDVDNGDGNGDDNGDKKVDWSGVSFWQILLLAASLVCKGVITS